MTGNPGSFDCFVLLGHIIGHIYIVKFAVVLIWGMVCFCCMDSFMVGDLTLCTGAAVRTIQC